MKNKKLIFLDIDGTLLDNNYQNNCPELPELIANKSKDGMLFALNSNRSLNDLIPVARQFKCNGPLIGENGLLIFDQIKNETRYTLDNSELQHLRLAKRRVENSIKSLLEKKYYENSVIWIDCDTVEALTSEQKEIYPDNAIVILNNKFREYSISAHIKRSVNGKLESDNSSVESIMLGLKNEYTSEDKILFSYSPIFSNMLMYSSLVNKKTAIHELKEKELADYEIFAIGDEIGDSKMVEEIGKFLRTANASDEVKNCALHTSESEYAKGVCELLTSSILS